MKLSEIANHCLKLQSELGETFMIPRLISESISVVPTDWRLLAQDLHRLDMALRDSFEPKLNRWLMDKVGFKSTPRERLIFRLRLDNAVNALPSFSDHTIHACQVELDLPCSQPEEAIFWAMTAFWHLSSVDTLTLTAKAVCRNH